ncbi:uncharacterized protein B0H64DRAFT_205535 [Chaetomium fimeti]|uniref:Uncharacterized protein n=1 Tax=Chaetomium fimeti TaxID=1854472 RepID=A0AAE0LPT8_9PEZI|nr:hypothetical protein B0H64DRAFT_205535 [Chaetomium fimeti]
MILQRGRGGLPQLGCVARTDGHTALGVNNVTIIGRVAARCQMRGSYRQVQLLQVNRAWSFFEAQTQPGSPDSGREDWAVVGVRGSEEIRVWRESGGCNSALDSTLSVGVSQNFPGEAGLLVLVVEITKRREGQKAASGYLANCRASRRPSGRVSHHVEHVIDTSKRGAPDACHVESQKLATSKWKKASKVP